MPYVNRHDGREVETVDSFDSWKEARDMVAEYRLADPSAVYRVSTRATRDWREAEREAARPSRVDAPAGLLAYHDSFSGLIPCRILAAESDGSGAIRFRVRYTGRRAGLPDAFKAGEESTWAARVIVPRDVIRRRGGCAYVGRYAWADRFPALATLRGVRSTDWQPAGNMRESMSA